MDTIEYSEIARDMRRVLEHEREKMVDKLQQVDEFLQLADQMDTLVSKVKSLQQEVEEKNNKIDELQQQLDEKDQQLDEQQQQLDEKNLQLTEFSKLSAGVAKKSSQEELLKALRTFINISKRKTLSKRITVKMVIMEFANSIGLSFPEEVSAVLDSLDDDTETVAPVIHIERAGDVIDKGGRKIVNNYQREGTND